MHRHGTQNHWSSEGKQQCFSRCVLFNSAQGDGHGKITFTYIVAMLIYIIKMYDDLGRHVTSSEPGISELVSTNASVK